MNANLNQFFVVLIPNRLITAVIDFFWGEFHILSFEDEFQFFDIEDMDRIDTTLPNNIS